MDARDRLIVALDFPSSQAALQLVHRLGDKVLWYKVGLELYLAEGPSIVRELTAMQKAVFLDLKLHDIPNTVAGAVRSAAATGARLLTIHAAGGPAMIRAAVAAAASAPANCQTKILAVTVLTSMDEVQLAATGIPCATQTQVSLLGKMALGEGADGLVCSPLELVSMRQMAGLQPELVVPGIRDAGTQSAPDDQRRTATARDALAWGASRIVVGRPITRPIDPLLAATGLLDQMGDASGISHSP